MEQPVILCGLGRVGWRVLEYLRSAGLPVVALDNACSPNDPRLQGARLVRGDCRRPEVLAEAGVAQARGVLILTSDDLLNISAALTVRHLNDTVRIVVRVFNQNLINRLGQAVHNVYALSTSDLTAPLLVLTAVTGEALGAFRLEEQQDGRRLVAEVPVAHAHLSGQKISKVARRHAVVPLAHLPAGGPGAFLHEMDPEARLAPGDRLVVCGEPRRLAPLLAQVHNEDLPHVRWAGLVRRFGRVALRTLGEVDWSVKICTAVLVGVILVSTLVFHRWVPKDRLAWTSAFFRTISVMATGADMHEEDLSEEYMKAYAASLRIVGAALTAAFTAILANYLIRARLGGALEVRRIPDGGHVIVCGLGNIGFTAVQELLAYGERVVVIEADRDSRFVATARRLGVPVVIGDTTVREVLLQAHSPTARAVIGTTSNDLVNLEVALLVRELNPSQRVVLCLSDPYLAQVLRDAANVRLALSVPTLAAPAFVAALFGDRVHCIFLVEGRLLAVVDLQVQAWDQCLRGHSARSLAFDYHLLPVAVYGPDGQAQPLSARLESGARLVAVIPLTDLERLLRRVPVPRVFGVEVAACPDLSRHWLMERLRQLTGSSDEEAAKALDRFPLRLGRGLTRGQAEEILADCRSVRVTATLREEGKG